MSHAWQQGIDQTLFNAYYWEHLRRILVDLPLQAMAEKGVAEGMDKEKSKKDKTVENIQNAFANLQKINPCTAESDRAFGKYKAAWLCILYKFLPWQTFISHNMIGIFESEIDTNGNFSEKAWEWK
jgi:hypothetical protein